MRYEELPGIPNIWIDFLNSKLPLLPAHLEMPGIYAVAESAEKAGHLNRRLNSGENPVAVVANFYASLFGGPVSQILKCLTAIKICEELKQQGIAASPVCWIHSSPPPGFSSHALQILDRDFQIRQLEFEDALSPSRIEEMLAEIERIGAGSFDEETLELLKRSFNPKGTLSSSNAQWIASLMKQWGMTVWDSESPEMQNAWNKARTAVLDQYELIQSVMKKQADELAHMGYPANSQNSSIPSFLMQSLSLPVVAFIADPQEIYEFAKVAPVCEALAGMQPLIWPRCSATIINSRSQRTLERYKLSFPQLFSGETSIMKFVKKSVTNKAPEILRTLKAEADACLLETGLLESQDKKFSKIRERCREKILYQLEKLHRHSAGAVSVKEQTAMRKIHRACNFLAPNRRLQETELGGIQIPLRYGRAGMQALYEKLDIRNLEHQIIELE
jgi:uncharacterized protein YllA (UPF0747 family)